MSSVTRYRTTRRRFGAAALAATAAPAGAALAACGLPGGAGGAPEAATQIKPGSTVQWMYWSTPGPWLEANQKEAAAFEAQQAKLGLKVEQLNTPAGAPFLEKLSSLLAGGTPPDVAEIMPWDVPQYLAQKVLLNLTPYVKRDKYDLADFFPAGFDQYRYGADGKPGGTTGGDLYGVPRDFPTRALGYNADAFREVGAKLPHSSGLLTGLPPAWGQSLGGQRTSRARLALCCPPTHRSFCFGEPNLSLSTTTLMRLR